VQKLYFFAPCLINFGRTSLYKMRPEALKNKNGSSI
jgi:hypothetical protein